MEEIQDIFQEIDEALSENPSYAQEVEAIYQFNLKDSDSGVYQLILQGEDSYTAKGEQEDPDCTLTMNTEDFKKMVEGELNGTQAFMTGRLKIKGNMGLALKLQSILSSYSAAK